MDAAVIRFNTSMFDVSKERPNPINPIHGESLLLWLAGKLSGRVSLTSPDTEDWGWYSTLDFNGRRYMVGSSASDEEADGVREWILQIVKHRSVKERLFGEAKLTAEDECVRLLLDVLKNEPAFLNITIE